MAKRKEIKFRAVTPGGRMLEGRQDGVIYRIRWDRTLAGTAEPAYSVSAADSKGKGRVIDTYGYKSFHLNDAKEFCQKIAAGEVDLAELRAEFEAEDVAKEQEARRKQTGRAKEVQARLDAMGLRYSDLLELAELVGRLGGAGHRLLLEWERENDDAGT